MERKNLGGDVRPELTDILNYIMDGASPIPIVLTAAPTSSGGELTEGQRGFYGGFVYETINGTTYKYTLTAV